MEAAEVRRPGQAEPRKQAPEAVGDAPVLGADGHAQEALVQLVAISRVGVCAEERVVARVLDVDFVRPDAALFHQAFDDLAALFAFAIGVRPREADHAGAHPAVLVAGHHLQLAAARCAACAADLHAVAAEILQAQCAHVEHHVRRHVGMRVVHLVEKLLAHRVEVHPPAGARRLGDDCGAVFADFGNRIAEVQEIRDRFPLPG